MDARRGSLTVPRVRQVGFFTPNAPPQQQPSRSQSGPPPLAGSPASNTLFPVMIPPARHHSDNLASRAAAPLPVPNHVFRQTSREHSMPVGSYNPSETLLGASPQSSSLGGGETEFSDDSNSLFGFRRSNSAKFASSFPGGGFDLTPAKGKGKGKAVESAAATSSEVPPSEAPAVTDEKKTVVVAVDKKNGGGVMESQKEQPSTSQPLKAKTTRAERRALQEAERAAKAALKGSTAGANKTGTSGGAPGKSTKQPSQKKDTPVTPTAGVSDKKVFERPLEKERKKDVPAPRMQFDDKSRVDKAKKRAVVSQTEAKNRVELFRHLPQYERGTQLPDLQSKYFELDLHPDICKVGLQFLAGDISGGNARCIAMLLAFQAAIRDYSTPPEKTLTRDLTAKIGSYVSFLIQCRPLSMSMGNAIRFLKSRITNLPINLSESEAKAAICSDITHFIQEKIILADKVIVRHAVTKVRDGDVLLTYGSSCVVEMILLYAHELGRKFRVVIVDSRPKLEGQKLLRRLVTKGLNCTYTHVNAVSYIMHEVTRVLLGASSVLANGTVYSRVGTASVAMVAQEFRVPVIICCEAYKFHERVQLDSICSNELGDPDTIARVSGRPDVNYLENWTDEENLQLLDLMYDLTPSEYVSLIVTDYGMIPTTSVPVIVREYRRELLLV